MAYNPNIHHRRSVRLKGWDYSSAAWYYVTIVIKNRECLFGNVIGDAVQHSPIGAVADAYWLQIPQHHQGVALDEYIGMPNHVHGIVVITERDVLGKNNRRDVQLNVPTMDISNSITAGETSLRNPQHAGAAISPAKGTLSVIIRTYKAAVTTWTRENGFATFAWQGRFHDHIIRDEYDLNRIRDYIKMNPLNWRLDEEHPP